MRSLPKLLLLVLLLVSYSCKQGEKENSETINVSANTDDPLPSWNEGEVKTAIIEYVARVTDGNGPDFIPHWK